MVIVFIYNYTFLGPLFKLCYNQIHIVINNIIKRLVSTLFIALLIITGYVMQHCLNKNIINFKSTDNF